MKVEEKVPGGKLLRMELLKGKVRLTGDFFLHPEDALEEIETILSDSSNALERLKSLERGVKFIGFSPEDLVRMLGRLKE